MPVEVAVLIGREDFCAQTPVCSCLVWSRADACSGTLAARSRGRDTMILVTAARAWPGGIPHPAGVGMWGRDRPGFLQCDSPHVSSQLHPNYQAVFFFPTAVGSPCAAPLGWLQPSSSNNLL